MAKMVESKHSPSTSTEKSTPVVTSGNTERHVEPACDILLTHQLINASAHHQAMPWNGVRQVQPHNINSSVMGGNGQDA
jgi:hypothetical protein